MISTERALRLGVVVACIQESDGRAKRASTGAHLVHKRRLSLGSFNLQSLLKKSEPSGLSEADAHIRYALRVGKARKNATYVGHSGGCDGTPMVSFNNARIWARMQDANNYIGHRNVEDVRSKLQLVEITCVVGRPYAVFVE